MYYTMPCIYNLDRVFLGLGIGWIFNFNNHCKIDIFFFACSTDAYWPCHSDIGTRPWTWNLGCHSIGPRHAFHCTACETSSSFMLHACCKVRAPNSGRHVIPDVRSFHLHVNDCWTVSSTNFASCSHGDENFKCLELHAIRIYVPLPYRALG